MSGISLVTKGFIHPRQRTVVGIDSGGGGAGLVHREEEIIKPSILVKDVIIENIERETLTADNIKIKSLKIVVENNEL
jgi:hypothetical protein